ncbi:MAG: hypothetical protein Kow0058_14580 [Roseovarius sp.]
MRAPDLPLQVPELKLRDMREVRAFSVAVTAMAVLGNLLLQEVLMPPEVAAGIRFSGSVIAVALAAPISFYVGLRLCDIHRLTLELRQAALRDPLTGAVTRAHFYERAARIGTLPMTLIVVDIDHFKTFNDRFGHLAGDAVLRQVAATLMQNCRREDVVARFGGEEFVILLPGAELADGARVAERLCARLRERKVTIEGAAHGVTASFGVAAVADPAALEAAIAAADEALYDAKRAGRDRVRIAG